MARKRLWAVALLCCICVGMLRSAAAIESEYRAPPGPWVVKTVLLDWKDARRNRLVPVRIYWPDAPGRKFPVIIFSHGLGGSRDGYAYLGQYWASFGYVCVHLQHEGSDAAVWENLPAAEVMPALRKAAVLPANALNRPLDVSFAIDKLEQLNESDPTFKGRLNLDQIGVAGHSFGALTTLAIAGEVFTTPRGEKLAWPDPRVKAAIAMSEAAPADKRQWDGAFAKIAIPMMHLTGTLDDSPIGETKAADRRVPFDHIPAARDQYLIVLQGGDHMVFSGRTRLQGPMAGAGNAAMDPTFQVLIQQATTAFWDATLKNDERARKWLDDGGCKAMLGKNASLEIKRAKKP